MAWPTSGILGPDDLLAQVQFERAFGAVVGDTDAAYDAGYGDGYTAGLAAGGPSVPTTGQTWPRGNP